MAKGKSSPNKLLVVITGPTAVGKTNVSIKLACSCGTEIISCDSRQFYREMQIGTAVPSTDELSAVRHHFVGFLSVMDNYDVSRFESDALKLLDALFIRHNIVVMTGGSGLYIDAVCRGFDDLPDCIPNLRKELQNLYNEHGITALQEKLRHLDPEYFEVVDKNNPNRLLRAVEVCLLSGKTYTALRQRKHKERPFRIIKIALNLDRAELFERISVRTDRMLAAGLIEETRSLLPYRHLNALNTVGYKELFRYLDGSCSLEQAIKEIKTNTRRYAKRQLTWLKKDQAYHWFEPIQYEQIKDLILSELHR